MTVLLALGGVLLIVVGIIASIALHEVGHLLPAKLFRVRVTQYMIELAAPPCVRARPEGEDSSTGSRRFPLGGYVAMIGMYPPPEETRHDDADTSDDDAEAAGRHDDPEADAGPSDPYLQQVGAQYAAPTDRALCGGRTGARRAADEGGLALDRDLPADVQRGSGSRLRGAEARRREPPCSTGWPPGRRSSSCSAALP